MQPLDSPDNHHVRAVHGWLDLGNPREAVLELERISSAARGHPDVIEARWRVCALERRWEQALVVAAELMTAAPDEATGYVDQAYTLHELRRTKEARDLLLPLARRFPKLGVIPYNLACYACQLGDLDEARRWLRRSLKLRGAEDLRRLASKDPDLRPLWPEIAAW